jgi:phosphoribosylglycinamide formyltransferase-1
VLSLVVLISGGGSNVKALLETTNDAEYPARVVAVGTDRDTDGLVHAEQHNVATFTVPFSSFPDRETWGDELLKNITVWSPDLVVLSGFMRLLPPQVVDTLSPFLINTHPAYLPEFPGPHGVRDALRAGVPQTGASLIVVDNSVDGGPIIVQERVPIFPDDTETLLHQRIKIVERRLLMQTILDIANGHINLKELPPQ